MPYKVTPSLDGTLQQEYQADPRLLMAMQALQNGSSTAPVYSPFQGIARALQGVAGGYFAGQTRRDYEQKQQDKYSDIAGALMPDTTTPASPQAPVDLGGAAGELDPSFPAMTADNSPARQQMVSLLSSGLLDSKSVAPMVADKLGFGKEKTPLKAGPGDVLLDPDTKQPIYSAPFKPDKPDKPEATPDIIQIAKSLFPDDQAKQNAYIVKNSPSNLRAITNINNPKQNWQVLTDPKTNTQFRYDLDSGKALTLDGKPYTPQGAGKIPSGGVGRSPASMYLQKYMENHPDATPEDIAKQANIFKTGQSEAGTIGTRSGAADVASQEVSVFAKQARDVSHGLPRSEYAALNSAMQAWDTKTSNPQLRKLMIAADALVNARARAISPTGSPHVNDQLEGRKMLSAAFASGDFDAAVDMMEQEAAGVRSSTKASKDEFFGNKPPAPAGGTKKPPTVSNW